MARRDIRKREPKKLKKEAKKSPVLSPTTSNDGTSTEVIPRRKVAKEPRE